MVRSVIILGSSGSIGTQALDVIRANPRRFDVVGLAVGSNRAVLDEQAAEFGVEHTAAGIDEAVQLVRDVDADVVLNGITGSIGLRPTLATLERGTTLAQALRAGTDDEVRRLVLTASGGPFRGRRREDLADVTPAEALAHPTWDMGLVVTTNSATLVNKGLEVIEAHLLFDVDYDRIDVVVHPQSIVHSMVEFIDGSTIAQASPPDMRLPISLGLDWPDRVGGAGKPLDWTTATSWTFEPLDGEAFPAVGLAKQVGRAGGEYPAVFNAANEEAVAAFHAGRIGFLDIVDTVRAVVESHQASGGDLTIDSLAEAERAARRAAHERIGRLER